jgi:hypothetical protein
VAFAVEVDDDRHNDLFGRPSPLDEVQAGGVGLDHELLHPRTVSMGVAVASAGRGCTAGT